MKPSSVLLFTAAGLAAALPAQPITARSEIQDTRSFLERAVDVFFARDLVPLNANTASPPADDAAAGKKAAAAATTSAAGANNAAAPPAATVSVAAPPVTTVSVAASAATDATAVPPPPPAATGAIHTPHSAGNGTASAGSGGKGKGKGKDQGKGKGSSSKSGNNNKNSLGDAISGALSQLGLDGVLNVGKINSLSGAQQIQLLAEITTLQTLADLSMLTSKQVAGALNQGFKSSGLNVVINV
ncbi:hypothetical protein ACQKWADRAFT_187399 [Trichoderma austrokoningii]